MKYLAFSILLLSALFFSTSCQTAQNSSASTAAKPYGTKRVNLSGHQKQLLQNEKAGKTPPNGSQSWRAYWTQYVLKLNNDRGSNHASQTLKSLESERKKLRLPSILVLNPAIGGLHMKYLVN